MRGVAWHPRIFEMYSDSDSDSHLGIRFTSWNPEKISYYNIVRTMFLASVAATLQKLGEVFLSQSISSSQVPPQSVNYSKIEDIIY